MEPVIEIHSACDLTGLLLKWGEPNAREELFSRVYPELKLVASRRMQMERQDHTLQSTALVSEVFLHLARQEMVSWRNRAHFLSVASEAMRCILVDHARARKAGKRGAGERPFSATGMELTNASQNVLQVLAIDQLLKRLAEIDKRAAQVVHFRYFGGLTFPEIAEVLDITERTVKRDWQVARGWLYLELSVDP